MDKYDSLNYVIYAPPLTSSAGIRALYRLSVELEKRGLSAPILCYKKTDGYHCINAFTKEMQENDIVIYPEVVRGNPLGFFRVVRYVLYYPGKLGGDTFLTNMNILFHGLTSIILELVFSVFHSLIIHCFMMQNFLKPMTVFLGTKIMGYIGP